MSAKSKYINIALVFEQQFARQVRYWTTLNEPHLFCVYGAGHGRMGATRVKQGYSEYLCGHHMLLAHAKAYRAYQDQFTSQRGERGGVPRRGP